MTNPLAFPRPRIGVLATALALWTLFAFVAPAGATDAKHRQAEVRRQRAESAAKVNALRASDAKVEGALETLDSEVARQEALAASAAQAAAAAKQRADAERAKERAAAAELEEVRARLLHYAVDAYTRRHGVPEMNSVGGITGSARRAALVRAVAGGQVDLADELRATRRDLADQRAVVDAAEGRADARRASVAQRLAALRSSRASRQRLADDVEARLERALAEADSLAAIDSRLAADIARRQATLARRVGPSSKGAPARQVGSVSLTTVRGITVATSLARNLEALLAAADGDGMPFGGQGYRSSEGQIEARKRNCGTSNYDIYEKPASQCSPATARPGQSMHEQGLAVDFTSGGRLVTSRSSPAYNWLKNNAGRFGLRNLPSEPWHWSTNGN